MSDLGGLPIQYICLICWVIFIFSLIVPLPILNYKGRIYGIKLMVNAVLSPLFGVTFPIIWMTDQLVSLITPLKDFAYTICYYTQIDFTTTSNPCILKNRADVVLVVALIAYSLRMLQCMKQGWDKKEYFSQPYFWNTIKYASSLITAVLSY